MKGYCHPLSLIMRNQGFEHYFIDACAGSGVVQSRRTNELVDGSPLIMAKTRNWVENRIKDKTREPSVQCIFIENDANTFAHLERATTPYSHFIECIPGDANQQLDQVLNKISRAFAFVYIDPFGLGQPVIQYETVERVLERDFTELFIHFSWMGVSRMAGQLNNIDHPNQAMRKKALGNVKTLDLYLTKKWREIERQNLLPARRRKAYLELYESILKQYYERVEHVEIPIKSRNPVYYLFFTTRNKTGYGIMKDIIGKRRRRGAQPLDRFMK